MNIVSVNRGLGGLVIAACAFAVCWLVGHAVVHDTDEREVGGTLSDAGPAPIGLAPISDEAVGDAASGQRLAFGACAFCHAFDRGGRTIVGPDLFGVAGGPIAQVGGFAYSPALVALRGRDWTPALLDAWLANPGHVAPGTRMMIAGVADARQRRDLIAYLESLRSTK